MKPTTCYLCSRVRPRFFDQVGHQTTNASIGNKHFSLNNDLVRLTKITNNLVKDLIILSFKVIFKCLKLVKSFQKKFCEEYLIRRPTYINEIFESFDCQSTLFTKNVPNFCRLWGWHYFVKKYLLVVWCPTWSKNLGRSLLHITNSRTRAWFLLYYMIKMISGIASSIEIAIVLWPGYQWIQ